MKYQFIFLIVLTILITSACDNEPSKPKSKIIDLHKNTILNLDFEDITHDDMPQRWHLSGSSHNIITDNTIHQNGVRSLKMAYTSGENSGIAVSTFPIEDCLGKTLTFKGHIKTENITRDYAGLWMRVDGEGYHTLAFDNMNDRGVTGTTDWALHKIELSVPETAKNINFGALSLGNGTAWFDNFSFEINGAEYEVPMLVTANESQLQWLLDNLDEFDTSEPVEDNSDLMFLKEYIGDRQIISLGEGTHGTSEFFKMKHRMVKFLAEEMDFTIFAIEANMPECRAINDYVLHGIGDPQDGLDGIYFWTWNTQEVLDMIEWMREYNQSGKGIMQFMGFDMQTASVAMKNVEDFILEVDPESIDSVKIPYNKIRPEYNEHKMRYTNPNTDPNYDIWIEEATRVINYLESKKLTYLSAKNELDVEWIIQDANIVLQCATSEMRDKHMADNVNWIIDQYGPDTKIVLWAHNGHVAKRTNWMGDFLDKTHGDNMQVYGFCFYEGTYTATGNQGLTTYQAFPALQGSFEFEFHKTQLPGFMLNLNKVDVTNENSTWLNEPMELRSIGAVAMSYGFYSTIVTDLYDVLIYIEQTTASDLLNY